MTIAHQSAGPWRLAWRRGLMRGGALGRPTNGRWKRRQGCGVRGDLVAFPVSKRRQSGYVRPFQILPVSSRRRATIVAAGPGRVDGVLAIGIAGHRIRERPGCIIVACPSQALGRTFRRGALPG